MMYPRLALGAALLAMIAAAPVVAQDGQRSAPPQKVVSQVDVFGDDPCPKGNGDEIVVCARKPEADRFRIPTPLRHPKPERKAQSWVSRSADIDETSRQGRPDSCSPVGSGGQTGCNLQFMRDAAGEKRADAAAAANVP